MTVQWSKQSIDQDVKYGKLLLRKLFKLKKLVEKIEYIGRIGSEIKNG